RYEEAPGSNKNDFDFSATGEFEENFRFTTINMAAFLEDCIQLNQHFSITPGIRFESLESEAEAEYELNGIETETESEKARTFILPGIGFQYKTSDGGSMYANISKSYQPVDYAQLVPLGSVSKVDPDMKDPKGWSADIGYRNNFRDIVNYDISLFYLTYDNRIGLVDMMDAAGNPYTLRTNLDKSIHKGIESYVELNIARAFRMNKIFGDLSIYNSFGYTRARYSAGVNKGRQVQYAPEIISRIGGTYTKNRFTSSLQFSYQSSSFGDAANTIETANPVIGRIPGYSVIDWSVSAGYKKATFRAGINNMADKRYFTQRTDEYPGPGIIPSIGRSYYIGVGFNL
ncbi:MAG: TonB-dependent receptor, partial [Ferruginibacter sp.]